MLGYWDDAEKTARGDRRGAAGCTPATSATIDDEGYCNIVGRIKDMVIRGGENVYPREIEEFLYRHPEGPGRAGDRRARRPATARSSAPGSSCAPGETLTDEEIREFCQGQIAHYKIPRYVEFVDEFPMTVTGKIQKFVMREAVETQLGLKAAKTA